MTDAAPLSLQESILAVLIFDDRHGTAVAAQVSPHHFDETYREIAEKVLAYRRKYGRGPGRAHLDDLFDKRLGENNRTRRILMDLAGIAPELNGEYVLSRTQRFVREQQLKAALVEGNSRWEQGGDDVSTDLEGILHKALRHRSTSLDAGTFLGDEKRALRFLERDTNWGISYGIKQLDDIKLSMRPKEMTLYIAGKGTGKTWMCVNVGKQALKMGKSVLHVTNEMSEELIAQRYFQAILGGSTHMDHFVRSEFEFNRKGGLIKMPVRQMRPEWNILADGAHEKLRAEVRKRNDTFMRLAIKEFSSGSLTLPQLEAYLDYLEQEHHFHPDLLVVDYPDLMAQDVKNYRISLGRTFVGIRGILKDRHMAGFCPTQGNRSSLRASKVSTDMVAEDISKLHTADIVLTYSRTEAEKERKTARLFVGNARNQRDGGVIILCQSYDTGQYVIESNWFQESYWDILKADEGGDEV